MARYGRRVEEVEAVQCLHDGIPSSFLRDDENMRRLDDGTVEVRRNGRNAIADVAPGDWLIRQPDGWLVTCWQRYFEETYEQIGGGQSGE